MSTNHYITPPRCLHCGQMSEKPIHLGKSSAGWCYGLHVRPELAVYTFADVVAMITGRINDGWRIEDEYGAELSLGEWKEIVTKRKRNNPSSRDKKWYQANYAQIGPNGLARHIIDHWHCIGHGEGTYDYIIGEFS